VRLDSMKPPRGSRKKRRRVGRGPGSGWGKTAGRGHKGYGSRAGAGAKPGFEGGQMPLARRLPKRGFKNPFRVVYQVVNLSDLAVFKEGAVVDVEALRSAGLSRRRLPVKILGGGKIDKGLTVKAHAFSRVAKEAIIAAGGATEEVPGASVRQGGAES